MFTTSRWRAPLALAAVAALMPVPALAEDAIKIDSGNTAWLLVSAALVMLMTPGLAFFYAGMVKQKNVVATLFKNYAALAIVSVLWVAVGYSLAFSKGGMWIGDWKTYFMFDNVGRDGFVLNGTTYGVPHLAFALFQMMFAIITPALIIGSLVERINFVAWLIILTLWSLLVYAPIAHWVWGEGGWIFSSGGLDFAGGLVVHISSGVSALIAALLFGRRADTNKEHLRPNDVSMVLLGAGLLWFGWFGFNAGSALAADGLAAHAFATTFVAASCAFLTWMAYDWLVSGRPSAVGSAVGLVAGLVVITPAAGFVSIGHAMIMGAIGGVVCNFASRMMKKATRLDDALDVFGCHGVGGLLGALMTGLFAQTSINAAVTHQGYLIDGTTELLKANIAATSTVIVYAALITFILIKLVGTVVRLRVSEAEEKAGLDDSQHGEFARYRDELSK